MVKFLVPPLQPEFNLKEHILAVWLPFASPSWRELNFTPNALPSMVNMETKPYLSMYFSYITDSFTEHKHTKHPGLHNVECGQEDESPLPYSHETPHAALHPVWNPLHRKDQPEWDQRGPWKWSEGWRTSMTSWENCGCSPWKREDSRKILLRPFSA